VRQAFWQALLQRVTGKNKTQQTKYPKQQKKNTTTKTRTPLNHISKPKEKPPKLQMAKNPKSTHPKQANQGKPNNPTPAPKKMVEPPEKSQKTPNTKANPQKKHHQKNMSKRTKPKKTTNNLSCVLVFWSIFPSVFPLSPSPRCCRSHTDFPPLTTPTSANHGRHSARLPHIPPHSP